MLWVCNVYSRALSLGEQGWHVDDVTVRQVAEQKCRTGGSGEGWLVPGQCPFAVGAYQTRTDGPDSRLWNGGGGAFCRGLLRGHSGTETCDLEQVTRVPGAAVPSFASVWQASLALQGG